ncbi:MAG TPA: hypothetical protein VM580_29245, partial [Labilithrix sp.]|nr:hypothetical protein [Labilithrix sp.]
MAHACEGDENRAGLPGIANLSVLVRLAYASAMHRGRFGFPFLTCLLGVLLAASSAQAQPKSPGASPARSSSQFTLRREEAGGAAAQTARARARAGDCAAALPLFDAAIRSTIEPTLRRDRGLCHQNLGNAFPAMDDYRAYLT